MQQLATETRAPGMPDPEKYSILSFRTEAEADECFAFLIDSGVPKSFSGLVYTSGPMDYLRSASGRARSVLSLD